jgi:hypothetical protein
MDGEKIKGFFGCLFALLIFSAAAAYMVFFNPVFPVGKIAPDNARFFVYHDRKWIVPDYADSANTNAQTNGIKPDAVVLFGEARRKDSAYRQYTTPLGSDWKSDCNQQLGGLIRSKFFPPPSRWTEDGKWKF